MLAPLSVAVLARWTVRILSRQATIMAKAQLPSRTRNKPSWSRITSRQV
nr:MAG TPA: hypothetical protein [Caudoviricetes sp.]